MAPAGPASFLRTAFDEFSSIEINMSPKPGSDASSRFSRLGSDSLRLESVSSAEAPSVPCPDPALVGSDNDARWSQYPNKYFFPDVPQLQEQLPTDQDMLECVLGTNITRHMDAISSHSEHHSEARDGDIEMHTIDHIDPSLSLNPHTDVFGLYPIW